MFLLAAIYAFAGMIVVAVWSYFSTMIYMWKKL